MRQTHLIIIKCWFYFSFFFFHFVFFFQSRLIILTKLQHVSYFSNWRCVCCYFRLAVEGKVVRCLRTGDVLNDKSSFETNKKNNSERLRASVLCRNEKESTSLCTNPGLPGRNKKKKKKKEWVTEEKFRGSVAEVCRFVCVCVCVCIYDRRAGMCSTEHIQRTGWAHEMIPSWDIGVCTVMMVSMSCVLTVKAFWCKVSCRVSRCSEFGKKKKESHLFLPPEGVMVDKTSHLERSLAWLLTELRGRYLGFCPVCYTFTDPSPNCLESLVFYTVCMYTNLHILTPWSRAAVVHLSQAGCKRRHALKFSENLLSFPPLRGHKKSSVPTGVLRLLSSTVWERRTGE